MSLAVARSVAPALLSEPHQRVSSIQRRSGTAMLAAARSRLLGRAAAFSASLVQPQASVREVSKMAAAAQARAAAREASADPATEAKASKLPF